MKTNFYILNNRFDMILFFKNFLLKSKQKNLDNDFDKKFIDKKA